MECQDEESTERSEGRLNAAISRAAVRTLQRYTGRGAARSTAFRHHHLVVVVMEEAMTTAEQSLAADGGGGLVREMRMGLDHLMEGELRAAIEQLTGCRVDAFLSATSVEANMACQVFALDRALNPMPHLSARC